MNFRVFHVLWDTLVKFYNLATSQDEKISESEARYELFRAVQRVKSWDK